MVGKWCAILLVLSSAVFGQNLLINGDFEDGASGWYAWWGGNSSLPAEDPIRGGNCAGVWWSDDGIFQGIPIEDTIYTVSGEMLHLSASALGQHRIGVIRAEAGLYDGADFELLWSREIVIDPTSPTDQWISGSATIDNTSGGANWLNINLFTYDLDGAHTGLGSVRFDNLSVTETAPINSPNYNGDAIVDLADFAELAGVWARESAVHNLSGPIMIDLEDLAVFADAWLSTIPVYAGYELVWSDEFGGTALNLGNWEIMIGDGCDYGICGWGNSELQYYRAENISVSDGLLIIESRRENYGGTQFTSGRLRTANKRDFLYGRIEARIKVPTGGGMWPAFWMMPTDNVYGGWAASGEIDIMETCNDTDYVGGTLHFGGGWPDNRSTGWHYSSGGMDFSEAFHVYALEWEPDRMRWYVDDILYLTRTNDTWYSDGAPENPRAPFDQAFHILLNAAVGGRYPNCTDPSCVTADLPQRMLVDWVRVYQKVEP